MTSTVKTALLQEGVCNLVQIVPKPRPKPKRARLS
jgi:hypothetical protein